MRASVMCRVSATAALVVGLLVALGTVLWVGVGPAEAAFAGRNGKIAFDSYRDGNAEIYKMNPDGSGIERLTFNAAIDFSPVYSPNGKKMAFASGRDGN